MLLQIIWEWLEGEVFNLSSEPAGPKPRFNPYRDVDPAVDRPHADRIRRENLRRYLESFTAWPEGLVLGEAPGWRGCRFSGVPFTSEAQLGGELPFCGAPSSLGLHPYREATATVFWKVMQDDHPRFLAWNSLPLHPHLPGQPLSNRKPSSDEICAASTRLRTLVRLLHPRKIVAVGKSAQAALVCLGLEGVVVRHPGHGGTKAFENGMRAVFDRGVYDRAVFDLHESAAGLPSLSDGTIDYNSGTFLAPTQNQNMP